MFAFVFRVQPALFK